MERHLHVAEVDGFAVSNRLRGAGKTVPVTQPHQIDRFRRCEHSAVSCTRMVGVTMRNHGFVNRTCRIDVESAELATHTIWRRQNDVLRPHGHEIIIADEFPHRRRDAVA